MPSCCLIRPAGTSPTSSTSPATSPCCRCRQNHPSSTRSKTSGNSCATTGSPIVSSGPTTTSLSTVATPGTNSSISLGPSCRSACATGPTGSDQRDLVSVAEIQVTPRMIEVGVLEAREHCLGAPLSDLVQNVYLAMALEAQDASASASA